MKYILLFTIFLVSYCVDVSAFVKTISSTHANFDSTEIIDSLITTIDSSANNSFAKEVLVKYVTAIGGEENLRRINDRITNVKGNVQGVETRIVFLQKSPNKLLQRIIVGDVEQKIIFNGSRGRKIINDIKEEINGDELVKLSYDAIMELMLDPELYNIKLRYDGTELIDGKNAFNILLTLPNGAEWHQYYDMQTGWKVRDSKDIITPQGVFKQITDFDDYRDVEGIIYPFKIEQVLGNQKLEFIIESIQVNTGLAEANFFIE